MQNDISIKIIGVGSSEFALRLLGLFARILGVNLETQVVSKPSEKKTAKIDGDFVEIEWMEGDDKKTLLITPDDVVKNYHYFPAYERLDSDTVVIDGKHYRGMSDEDVASFTWRRVV